MDTIDDFFRQEEENRAHADAHVTEQQRAIKPGGFCVHQKYGFKIYSEILDAAEFLRGARAIEELDEDERYEYEETRETYASPHMANYRFTRSFSVACPRGELGDIHIVIATPITAEEFQKAREANWA